MRRPETIAGMLVWLARHHAERHPRAMRWGALGVAASLTAATAAALLPSAPLPEHAQTPRAASHRGSTWRTLSRPDRGVVLAPGRCVVGGGLCFQSSECQPGGYGDRCAEPTGITARVLAEVSRRDDDANAAINPALVWNGSHFGVAWVGIHDDRFELWFARLGADGRRVGAPVRVTTSPTAKVIPSLAAVGDGWGLAWTDLGEDDIAGYFVRLSAEGRPVGQPEPVARDGVNLAPRVVSNGREYALAWYNVSVTSQMSLHFGRIDANGRRVGGTSVAARGFLATGLADLAWQGDAYGLAWSTYVPRDNKAETHFVGLGASGEAVARPVRVSQGSGQNGGVALAWSGQHFGTVWEDSLSEDEASNRLAFAGVTPRSVAVARRDLTDRSALVLGPSLGWNGARHALAWTRLSESGPEVLLARLGADGAPVGSAVRVTPNSLGLLPSVAVAGATFGLAWTDLRASGIHIRFARFDAEGRRVGDEHQIDP